MATAQRRRRIDRVTDPAFVDGLSGLEAAELRSRRDDCREEETRLSYARRVLQGQLDIALAEQRRRAGLDDEGGLVGALSDILADHPSPGGRELRTAPLYTPEESGYGARAHDAAIDDPALSRVPDLDDAELAALVERLRSRESELSQLRRTVLAHLDALQAELVGRYRDEGVDLQEVVGAATGFDAPADGPDAPAGDPDAPAGDPDAPATGPEQDAS